MKMLVQSIFYTGNYAKIREWVKLISITGGAQIIVQAFGLLSGILVIRLLPTHEYALYTIANTMLGTMTILADGGISAGVMAQGGKAWQDPKKLGVVLATGFNLRKKFAIGSLLVSIPILIYLLMHHGASVPTILLIILSIIPAFLAALSDTLLEIAPKLKQDLHPLQINQLWVSFGRLTLQALTAFIFPWAFIAILAGGLPRIWGNIRLKKISSNYADWSQVPDILVKQNILLIVKRILPGAIYYSLSGQITIWLISFFGTTESLAQVGALGRLTIGFTLISTMFSTLVVPRFARLAENKKLLLSRFFQIQLILFSICFIIIGFVAIFSTQILLILGNDYSNLTSEIVIISAGSCMGLIGGITYSISVSRGYILPPVINIIGNLSTQIFLIFLLDLSTTKGVLLFSVYNASAAFLMLFFYYVICVFSLKEDK